MTFKSQEIVKQSQFSVIFKSSQVTVLSKYLSKKQYTYIYDYKKKGTLFLMVLVVTVEGGGGGGVVGWWWWSWGGGSRHWVVVVVVRWLWGGGCCEVVVGWWQWLQGGGCGTLKPPNGLVNTGSAEINHMPCT